MASTSSRLLDLLSLLGARERWSGRDLADRLEISTRTLRRDVESLRVLGYSVDTVKGPEGGYRLSAGARLPPLLLDDDQAIAVAVALQTAPTSVSGIDDAVARALTSIKQLMPPHLRAEADNMHLTAIRNWWEFAAPPIAAPTLRAVGAAIRHSHLLRFDHLGAEGGRPDPQDPDFAPPRQVEPHHLLTWAGRWYLVAYVPSESGWRIYRVDRLHLRAPTGVTFSRRLLPEPDVAQYVMTSWDRDDTPARWQCSGTALLDLPPGLVARWAPGGSLVEYVGPARTRLTVGAWSWAGVAGLLATFDAEITIVGPDELVDACRTLAERYLRATATAGTTSTALR
jgi:predicted DNA-binding transcriptional regulator YafY